MAKAERLSDSRVSRNIALPESSKLDDWRRWVAGAGKETPPIDWFLALAAMSDPSADLAERQPAEIKPLGPALGLADSRAASDGAVFRGYRVLLLALGDAVIEDARTSGGAILGLFHQARMATFMPYRDGLARYLRDVPLGPEGAVHAYVRVVAEWAARWPGLAVATRSEFDEATTFYSYSGRPADEAARHALCSRTGLPIIVAWDLQALLDLVEIESNAIESSQEPNWMTTLAIDTITSQLCYAVGMMARDPSLEPLSAANLARGEANAQLGGALGRLRVRNQDSNIISLRVLEEVRKHFLEPAGSDPTAEEVEARALMAKKFDRLRIAVQAMGRQAGEGE